MFGLGFGFGATLSQIVALVVAGATLTGGLRAARPLTPAIGDMYFSTDIGVVGALSICIEAGVWLDDESVATVAGPSPRLTAPDWARSATIRSHATHSLGEAWANAHLHLPTLPTVPVPIAFRDSVIVHPAMDAWAEIVYDLLQRAISLECSPADAAWTHEITFHNA